MCIILTLGGFLKTPEATPITHLLDNHTHESATLKRDSPLQSSALSFVLVSCIPWCSSNLGPIYPLCVQFYYRKPEMTLISCNSYVKLFVLTRVYWPFLVKLDWPINTMYETGKFDRKYVKQNLNKPSLFSIAQEVVRRILDLHLERLSYNKRKFVLQ